MSQKRLEHLPSDVERRLDKQAHGIRKSFSTWEGKSDRYSIKQDILKERWAARKVREQMRKIEADASSAAGVVKTLSPTSRARLPGRQLAAMFAESSTPAGRKAEKLFRDVSNLRSWETEKIPVAETAPLLLIPGVVGGVLCPGHCVVLGVCAATGRSVLSWNWTILLTYRSYLLEITGDEYPPRDSGSIVLFSVRNYYAPGCSSSSL